ncbi:hypothetical protein DITRI_Ditri16bG0031900 [Diplodiscus trichospermus]
MEMPLARCGASLELRASTSRLAIQGRRLNPRHLLTRVLVCSQGGQFGEFRHRQGEFGEDMGGSKRKYETENITGESSKRQMSDNLAALSQSPGFPRLSAQSTPFVGKAGIIHRCFPRRSATWLIIESLGTEGGDKSGCPRKIWCDL